VRAGALVALAVALALLHPALAVACPSCISSAYGDRTYNWAFFGLLLMPFAVGAGIGGVLGYLSLRRRQRRPVTLSLEETT
jgi:hypothetical protein